MQIYSLEKGEFSCKVIGLHTAIMEDNVCSLPTGSVHNTLPQQSWQLKCYTVFKLRKLIKITNPE